MHEMKATISFRALWSGDYLVIHGTGYTGFNGPMGIPLAAGETMWWRSDASVHRSGWTICGSPTYPTCTTSTFPSLGILHKVLGNHLFER